MPSHLLFRLVVPQERLEHAQLIIVEIAKIIMKDFEAHLAEDKGGSLVATAASLLALSWITVGLRIYTRAVLMKSIMADDWLIIVAQVLYIFRETTFTIC